jgi:EAL domain-containing protein (putative c-di-GMP-specific phosphodiesterase class I)
MDDVENSIDLLREIISMGIKLAIDDFGTGYSSMEYLKKMPLSCLKIAMPFVREICDNKDDRAISTAIIQIAHSLELNVIAEGVEDKKQYELLESLQCDIIQGYLVSKPQPVNEIEGFLKEDWTIK